MDASIPFLLAGAAFGLSAGLSPGPLLTLVISETLRHGVSGGIKVALAPLVTDLPIVCASLLLLSRLADIGSLLAGISFTGALFLAYLGWEGLRFDGFRTVSTRVPPASMRKGVVANFLNPSPYLFWLSVGGPMAIRAQHHRFLAAAGFVACFYLLLVGSKLVLAVIVGRSRAFLGSGRYVAVVRLLGGVMWGFATLFFWDALKYAGIVNALPDG